MTLNSNKSKLAIFDLDGTLFNTVEVNYYAYKDAVEKYGFTIDYEYYRKYCNGRHYKEFLPKILIADNELIERVHELKKKNYNKYIDKAIPNQHLFDTLKLIELEYYICIVTTASAKNTNDILVQFNVKDLFDLIVTQEDITMAKPNPEGFFKAMDAFGVVPKNTIIFEDSDVGLDAANQTGATVFKVLGFN